jgi:hypothetical protein
MELSELRKIVALTDQGYWEHVETDDGSTRFVHIHDIDIVLERTGDLEHEADDYDLDWVERMSRPGITLQRARIYYRGSLVQSVTLALVEGGRALLPMPTYNSGDYVVSPWEREVARVVSSLDSKDFERYWTKSGISSEGGPEIR